MKKRPCVTGIFALIFCLYGVSQASSWAPQLVATDPDGACILSWAADGKSVQISPCDERQFLQWAWCSLDAKTGAITPSPAPVGLYELQAGDNGSTAGNTSVDVYSRSQKKTIPLQNTPWSKFGFDIDSLSYGWRFQASRFSDDWKTVSIISGGTIYTWATATGKLLKRVRLTEPQSKDENYLFASFSSDGHSVVSSLGPRSKVSGSALFDASSGRKIFMIPGSQGVSFWTGFFQGNRLLVSCDNDSKSDHLLASIWSIQQKRKLWSARIDIYGGAKTLPHSNIALITTNGAIEVRDIVTGKLQRKLSHPARYVTMVAPSPDGSQIWASYGNGQIWRWYVRQ